MTEPLPTSASPSAKLPLRRRALLGSVAGVALASGAAVAWYRARREDQLASASSDFWALELATPTGQRLRMATFRGRPMLLNFWATWCPPCVDELPLLNDFYKLKRSEGWQLVGLAVDQAESVKSFLQRMPLEFPIGLVTSEGLDLSRSFGNLNGALPFTVILDSGGQVLHRKIGRVTADELHAWSAQGRG